MGKLIFERPFIKKLNSGMPSKFGMKTRMEPITEIDEIGVKELIEKYGSPLFVISEKTIRKTYKTAERAFSRIGEADLVLTDPPRSGTPASVLKSIIRLRPREIIMISCDAPTFARDAARLVEASWTPSEIHLIDMFPGTYHVESVALFRRD